MLSESQRREFSDRGLLKIAGLIPEERVRPALDRVLAHLERAGLWKEGEWHLEQDPRPRWPNSGFKLTRLNRSPVMAEVITNEVVSAVAELHAGRDFAAPLEHPQLLFSLPNADTWFVPSGVWHLDAPRLPDNQMSGVQIFTFLNHVAPGCGGTLVVAGSHRFLNDGRRIRSRDVKRALKRIPWFQALMTQSDGDRTGLLGETHLIDGVEVQLAELHGAPGDVYFMDMRMLHTVAPNAGRAPRIMLAQRFYRADALAEIYGNPE